MGEVTPSEISTWTCLYFSKYLNCCALKCLTTPVCEKNNFICPNNINKTGWSLSLYFSVRQLQSLHTVILVPHKILNHGKCQESNFSWFCSVAEKIIVHLLVLCLFCENWTKSLKNGLHLLFLLIYKAVHIYYNCTEFNHFSFMCKVTVAHI